MAVDRWMFDSQRPPETIVDLADRLPNEDAWRAEREPYQLNVHPEASLREAATILNFFLGKGFTKVVAVTDHAETEFYAGYAPAEFPPVDRGSFPTLDVIAARRRVVASVYTVSNGKASELVEEQSFDEGLFSMRCPPKSIWETLRRMCNHPGDPCRRVTLLGPSSGAVSPLLNALAVASTVSPVVLLEEAQTLEFARAMATVRHQAWFRLGRGEDRQN